MKLHESEVSSGQRFAFGANWKRFLEALTDRQIESAEMSLKTMLGVQSLAGKTVLDVGSGSGLFSLAARRLGARVTSFDFDPDSVECTKELRRRYFGDDPEWAVLEGSILDPSFLRGLSTFDIVYAWGVLHHTGAMWEALKNVVALVNPHGRLFVSIYNDQGMASRNWRSLKRAYNYSPRWIRFVWYVPALLRLWGPTLILDVIRGTPLGIWRRPRDRGMSLRRDLIDWLGGYPFEVARPEEVFSFYRQRGFTLEQLKTCAGGIGCNEYVFQRVVGPQPDAS